MRQLARKSGKAFFAAFLLPMLSVYILTVSCALGDVLDCCDDMMVEMQVVNSHHDEHGHTDGHEHEQRKAHQPAATQHHGSSSEDEDCCNDLTTNFFSIFQAQHQVLSVEHASGSVLPHFAAPATRILNAALSRIDQTAYNGFKLPLKTNLTGAFLRILHQSFLN